MDIRKRKCLDSTDEVTSKRNKLANSKIDIIQMKIFPSPHTKSILRTENSEDANDSSDEEHSAYELCRLCGVLIDENKLGISLCDEIIQKKIALLLSITVDKSDLLPLKGCQSCVNILELCYNFFMQVQNVDKKLRAKYRKKKVRFEDEVTIRKPLHSEYKEALSKYIPRSKETDMGEETADEIREEDYFNDEDDDFDDDSSSTGTCTDYEFLEVPSVVKCRLCDVELVSIEDTAIHTSCKHIVDGLFACPLCVYGFKTHFEFKRHLRKDHNGEFSTPGGEPRCDERLTPSVSKIVPAPKTDKSQESYPIISLVDCDSEEDVSLPQDNQKVTEPIEIADDDVQLQENTPIDNESPEGEQCESIQSLTLTNPASEIKENPNSFPQHFKLPQSQLEEQPSSQTDVYVCLDCGEAFEKGLQATHQHSCRPVWQLASINATYLLRCEFCDKSYFNVEDLNVHRTAAHCSNMPFECSICNAKFATFARCCSHRVEHGAKRQKDEIKIPRYFACDKCPKSYQNWSFLVAHKRLKHPQVKEYSCPECGDISATFWMLIHHKRVKHDNFATECEECGKSFSNLQSLKVHRLNVHGDEPTNINIPETTTTKEPKLNGNMNTRPRLGIQKPYRCDLCGISFQKEQTLFNHKEIHNCFKKFQCVICYTECNSTEELLNHTGINHAYDYYLGPRSKGKGKMKKIIIDKKDLKQVQFSKKDCSKPSTSVAITKLSSSTSDQQNKLENYVDLGDGVLLKLEPGMNGSFVYNGKHYTIVNSDDVVVSSSGVPDVNTLSAEDLDVSADLPNDDAHSLAGGEQMDDIVFLSDSNSIQQFVDNENKPFLIS